MHVFLPIIWILVDHKIQNDYNGWPYIPVAGGVIQTNCEAVWLAVVSLVHSLLQIVADVELSNPEPYIVTVCPPKELPTTNKTLNEIQFSSKRL